jgi:hypothetical protein
MKYSCRLYNCIYLEKKCPIDFYSTNKVTCVITQLREQENDWWIAQKEENFNELL